MPAHGDPQAAAREPATVDRSWASGGTHPRLVPGTVQVWLAELAQVPQRLLELLDEGELERAARIRDPQRQARWLAARAVLRELLGRHLASDPRELTLTLGPHGKPALAQRASNVRFNLSHSREVALYAFSLGEEVGVDVELPRRELDVLALAARALGTDAVARLRELDAATRRGEFLRLWTRHEAAAKCGGGGLGGAPAAPAAPAPWVLDLDPGHDGAAAVAGVGNAHTVRCYAWEPSA